MRRWIAVILFAGAQATAIIHDDLTTTCMRWSLLIAGVVLLIERRAHAASHGLATTALSIAGFAAAGATFPAQVPAALLGCVAVLATALTRWRKDAAALAAASTTAACIVAAQAATGWIATAWMTRQPVAAGVAHPIAAALSWAGLPAAGVGGKLAIGLDRGVHAFPVGWDLLGAPGLWMVFVGGGITLARSSSGLARLRATAILLVVLAVCALVRAAGLLILFETLVACSDPETKELPVWIFRVPAFTSGSLLVFCLPVAVVMSRMRRSAPPLPLARPTAIAVAGAVVGLCVFTSFHDPGRPKPGRVLIDDAHGGWERSDLEYDEDWYGSESGYNFNRLRTWMGHHFDVRVKSEGRLTTELLERMDVLVLKAPMSPYSPEEIEAVEDFVRRGGGLFAVGDHSNVFGTSGHLNRILEPFGVALENDCVFDAERTFEEVVDEPGAGGHPIAAGIPFFRFAVGCSVRSHSWRSRPVVRRDGLWTLPVDYSISNFYPVVEDSLESRFGTLDQMVSTTCGRGRVVVFTDSTICSNFDVFYPGRAELMIRTIEWLNRTNAFEWVRWAGLALAACGLLLLLVAGGPPMRLTEALPVLAAAMLAAAVTTTASRSLSSHSYPMPRPDEAARRVVFDMDVGDYRLPIRGFLAEDEGNFELFYVWSLRAGVFPSVSEDFESSCAGDAPIVLIRPRFLSSDERERLLGFVERGGRVLVLFDDAAASGLMRELDIEAGTSASGDLRNENGSLVVEDVPFTTLRGGEGLLFEENGAPVVVRHRRGKGVVLAAGLAAMFDGATVGKSYSVIPTVRERSIYEVGFALIDGLDSADPGERLRDPATEESR